MDLTKKFSEYGFGETPRNLTWKCTTNESCYKSATLIGNWNESRFDVEHASTPKPLPSQFDHYFETTNKASYMTQTVQHNNIGFSKVQGSFPGHQPKFTEPMESTVMASYKHPNQT